MAPPNELYLQNYFFSSTIELMFKRGVVRMGQVCFVFLCLFSLARVAAAESLQSSSYRFEESTLGGGGLNRSSSSSYQGSSSVGDVGNGAAASANYQVQQGSQTTNDPALSFSIGSSSANFGVFSPATAATTTSSFSISNYTSYGYVVQILGTPPTNGAHTLTPITTNDTSHVGTEQFGINLVANTLPVSVGANPDHGQFGFGTASSNYGTSNNYRYVSGETIASSPKSSGVTTYTISYLANVGSLTPGGTYTSNQTLVVTGTF
jgi:hypothetical protein